MHAEPSRAALARPARLAHLAAWLLLLAGLAVVALNPAVPSVRYALLWLGMVLASRGVAALVPWAAAGIDLVVLLLCAVGLEIGGLILVPSLLSFAVGDALQPAVAPARE